jgi:signal transduction histidine kinase
MTDMSAIQEITALAASTSDQSELLQAILERGLRAVNGNRGFIAVVDFDSGRLVIRHTAGEGWDQEKIQTRLHLHTGDGTGITTYVGATGKPYRTGDVHNDPYYIPYFDDVRSELAVPVVDAYGRTRGVINVESPKPDAFGDDHIALMLALANIACLSLTIDEHQHREQAFVEIGGELASSPNIRTLAWRVVQVAAEVLRYEDCSLFLLDRDGALVLEASRGHLNAKVGRATYKLGEGLTGWIAEHGQPIRTTDARSDPRWLGLHREFPPEDMGAYLGVPIEGRDGVLGALRVLRRKSPFPWLQTEFTSDDEGVLLSIASQVGTVIQNLRLVDRVVNAERMAAWGEMSARSAHMIGNRVFAIKGDLNELDYLLAQPQDDHEGFKALVESIRKGVFRLEEILQEFRDFVMATQLALGEQDLNQIVQQSADEFFPKRSPVHLEMTLDADLPNMQGDQSKLKRCFAELIENAVSFQTDGGSLRIATSVGDPKEARRLCGLSGKRRYIRVEFADSGPGIPDDAKSKIFTPFYTSRAKGMGLGLSIVKGIVEAHHGRICESGAHGTGAKFVIFFPALSNGDRK